MKRTLIFIGIICTILNLFGCWGRQKDETTISKETQKEISHSMDSFVISPIYKKLTEQIIDSTSDDDLLQVIFDNLTEKLPADYEKKYGVVMSWNKSQQAIYMIWLLEGEVNNGGYNQFYYNSSGQFYKYLPEALKFVGANKFAALTGKANDIFEKENSKIKQHQDGTSEGFSKSYENNPLNKFDDEFYSLSKTESLQGLQIDYIRKHKKDFVDK